jgi:hypothetical protein
MYRRSQPRPPIPAVLPLYAALTVAVPSVECETNGPKRVGGSSV